MKPKTTVEKKIKEIKRATRKRYNTEEKIRIIMEGMRGEESIAAICRREGIPSNTYYKWTKDFMEAGRRRLSGDILREANRDEVQDLRKENTRLKLLYAELAMNHDLLKKSDPGLEMDEEEV